MSKILAKDVLDRAKQAAQLESDAELATYWDKSKQTVSSWRKRGTIPLNELADLALDRCVSLDWLLTGRLGISDGAGKYVTQTPEQAVDRYKEITRVVITTVDRQDLNVDSNGITALADFAYRQNLNVDGIRELVALFGLYDREMVDNA